MAQPQLGSPFDQVPNKIQVKYWEALCKLVQERGDEGMPADGWPSDLPPSSFTLETMIHHELIERRNERWHLGRQFPFGLKLLEHQAKATPKIVTALRPAPDLPSYDELEAWDEVCRWLDTQPQRRARLPFVAFPDLPLTRLKELRKYRILRHTGDCQWALSPRWKDKLLALWQGSLYVAAETPRFAFQQGDPQSLVAGVDTFYLNRLDLDGLPAHLRLDLDDLQEEARNLGKEVETPWMYDGVPLLLYQYGSSSKASGGVSWSYILRSPDVALLIHRTPLGGITAQIRLGSAALWRLTPLGAYEEADLLIFSMWGKTEGTWQVSQAHLCHDVMHAVIDQEQLDRFVSRSRSQAVFDAARHQVAQLLGVPSEDDLLPTLDWDTVFGMEDTFLLADPAFDEFAPQDDRLEADDLEDRDVTLYRWGKRLSGVAWSPGQPVSFVMYDKVLEMQRHGKRHMEPIWHAAGWDGEVPVTRHEVRLRREIIRELRVAGLALGALDDPRVFLQHLQDIWARMVGKAVECPDAIEVAWLRRVEPQEGDTNKSRWPTDPAWRVVQDAAFADVPEEIRQVTREHQTTHAIDQRVQGIHGGLISFAALVTDDEGERWDLSQAVGQVVPWLEGEAIAGEKDFGKLVRERKQKLGLPVRAEGRVLPFTRRQVMEGTDQEPAPEGDETELRAQLVAHAWRCVERAEREFEAAIQRGVPAVIEDRLGVVYSQALADYARVLELVERPEA